MDFNGNRAERTTAHKIHMSSMALEFLFVYGTLRKQSATRLHPLLADYCVYCSPGFMHGKLYEVRGYPGAIVSGDSHDRIFGELYRILNRKRALTRLDDYEECSNKFPLPHEYSRKRLPIALPGGGSVVAWVYLYNDDVSKLRQIVSGDYLDR